MITEIDNLDACTDLIDRIAADPRYSDPHFTYDPQNLYSALQKPDHRVYASSEDGAVNGIFAWVILPEDRYAELITGLSEDTAAWEEMLGLIERENPGIQMDFVINPKHDVLRGILQRRGVVFEKEQKKFRLVRETEAAEDPAVGELQPEYEDQYREVHAKDTYWTAERILEARDIFRVYTAIEQGRLVGYMDITTGHPENEPYDLWTASGFEHYRKALLAAAIRRNRPSGMMVVIDTDNAAEIALYEETGFEAIARSESVYATYQAGE
ncbi:MAG: hypothetical protein J6Y20_10755 [Lachnospiraceae bacterium]|nr:hypothetical protein [Lachnospiraceae bacterium]